MRCNDLKAAAVGMALPLGLALSQGAVAADLPSKAKGPAIEYVRICDAYGNGFFFIPGTDTCLKVSGYIRADYQARTTQNTSAKKIGGLVGGKPVVNSEAAQDSSGNRVRARVEFDARTGTAYGPLRGYIRYQAQNGSGSIGANDFTLDVGYIQWAGITAGRQKSFFEGFGSGPDYPLDNARAYDFKTQLLAYTTKFGPLAATISIEDPLPRRGALFGVNPNMIFPALPASLPSVAYGGSKLPDLVGNLKLEQDWGAVLASGALHQVNTVSSGTIGAPTASATGYAALAGVLIKLPMLAKGDEIFFQGAYANGAKSYLSLNGGASIGSTTPFELARNDADAVRVNNILPLTGYHLEKSRGYTLQAGLTHYWLPNVFQRFWAAYTVLDYGSVTRNTDWRSGGIGRGRDLILVTNVTWQPAKGLDIIADVSYSALRQTVPNVALDTLPVGLKSSSNTLAGRLRLLRSF